MKNIDNIEIMQNETNFNKLLDNLPDNLKFSLKNNNNFKYTTEGIK